MVSSRLPTEEAPSRDQARRILQDTARAVKVMKASWLQVALNLKQIRTHELWRHHEPPAQNYEDYVFGVLKLNKYVANRMLQAMDYTAERRPQLLENFREEGPDLEIPSFEVVNQLRRAERNFEGHEDVMRDLESRVFDEGVGRVVLKREIDQKLAEIHPDDAQAAEESTAPATYKRVIADLMSIESALIELKASKEARRLAFQLVEVLQKEQAKQSEAADSPPTTEPPDEVSEAEPEPGDDA